MDTLLDHNLLPVTSKPSRITQSTATLIDHIFAQNIHENSKSGILLESLSDHCPTYYLLGENIEARNLKEKKTRTRVINETNKEKFKEMLSSHNWNDVLVYTRKLWIGQPYTIFNSLKIFQTFIKLFVEQQKEIIIQLR